MIQSVERCAEILNCVSEEPEGLTFGALAEAVNLKYTTAYNLAQSLVECGLLEKTEENLLFSGWRIGLLNTRRLHAEYLRQLKEITGKLAEYPREHSIAFSIIRNDRMEGIGYKRAEDKELKFGSYDFRLFNTVAGIIFFTYLPEAEKQLLLEKNKTEPELKEYWGTFANFQKSMTLCAQNGYSIFPHDSPEFTRIGVPVFADGKLFGALTWGWEPPEKKEIEKVIKHLRNLPRLSAEINETIKKIQA